MTDELVKVAGDSVRGGFFLISGTALSTVILAISSILIARFLGPELYGQYTLALVVPQLLFLFTDLGINQGIIKFTANLRTRGETSRIAKIVKYGLMLQASVGIAIFIINYILADWFSSAFLQRPDLAFYVRIASTTVLFQVVFTTATSAFVGLDKAEFNALTSNIQAVAKSIVQIILVFFGFSVAGALLGHVASYMVGASAGALMLLFVLHQSRMTKSNHNLKDDFKTLMRYGAPLYISLLVAGFMPVFQNILLAIFTTDADVGNYKAAANFGTLITVFSIPITTALLPAFSKLESLTTQKIRAFFKFANKYTTMLILPITMLVIIFSSQIVQIIYGATYQSAPAFLAEYSLLYLLVGIGYLTLSSFFNGLGGTKTTLKINLVTFLTLALLSPISTQLYGVIGLIIAFLVASTAGTSYGLHVARRKFRVELDTKPLIKIYSISILSSLLPLILLLFSSLPKLFIITAGALLYIFTYLTLIPIAKVIDHSELQTVASVLQKIKPLAPIIMPLLRYENKILSYNKRV